VLLDRPLTSLPADRAHALIAALNGTLDPAAAARLTGDPDAYAVGWGAGDAWAPAGLFALRPLRADALGLRLARRIGGPDPLRFPGPHGLATAIAVRPGPAAGATMRAILAAIGHRALVRMYGRVFFHAPDRELARRCRALGAEPSAELALLAGGARMLVYDPSRPANLARLAALEVRVALAGAAARPADAARAG
jgi:hypothetical protein